MKKLKYVLILVSLFWCNICISQNKTDTLKILFVGNSYIYYSNMPHLISLISDSTQTKLLTSKSVAGGVSLSQHWRGERGLRTKELIAEGDFDIVVLQDHSMSAIEQPDSLLIYSKKFADYIRKNGAQPFLYCTWAREKVPQYQDTITDVYNQAARENNTGIVNIGETWAFAKRLRPNIELYLSDGSHQSPLGAFLTACAFVKELSKELPDELPNYYKVIDANGESVELMILDPLDITFCLKVVNEIAK
jgi:hypothetical protein